MSRTPYLYRRGNVFYFRAAVPAELRDTFQRREIVQSLKTEKRAEAVPLALGIAAELIKLFNDVRSMPDIKRKRKEQALRDKLKVVQSLHQEELEQKELDHIAEIRRVKAEVALRAENEALKAILAGQSGNIHSVEATEPKRSSAPLLSAAIDEFLEQYDKNKAAMLKKHKTTLPKLLTFIGDKPIDQVKHIDVSRYAASLAEQHNGSFKTAKSSIKALVDWGQSLYEDAFAKVRVENIKYSGSRIDKEEGQRSFKDAELARLFTGKEMKEYCRSSADVHKFWLPVIGLYTGARVNEICQLNPAADIKQGDDGIWYFNITPDSATAAGVKKSVKTVAGNRVVPLHSKLIDLGLLDYIEDVKKAGHKILFPQWRIMQGRAGENPARWFRRFLDDIGLRDDTGDKKLAGMHAFRHTVITRACDGKFIHDMLPIVGHESDLAGETGKGLSAVTRGYIDAEVLQIPLSKKQETIEQLKFDIAFYRPIKPVFKKR
jgi:integrase